MGGILKLPAGRGRRDTGQSRSVRRDQPARFPKVVKRLRTKRAADQALDKAESQAVRIRSEGRCEVEEVCRSFVDVDAVGVVLVARCARRAEHVMHLIGGRGTRGRGLSALKEHKLHGCARHHREIDGDLGGKKLKRIGGVVPLWTDPYQLVR